MRSKENTRRRRFAVALLVMALIAVSCTSSDDEPTDVTTEETSAGGEAGSDCVERLLVDENEVVAGGGGEDSVLFATLLCTRLDDDGVVDGIHVEVCADGAPQIVDRETGELVFWSHGIFRFHPADEIEPENGDAFQPVDAVNLVETVLEEQRWDDDPSIVVIDEAGAHLDHVVGVIEQLTSAPIQEVPLTQVFTKESDIVDAILPYTDNSEGDGPLLFNMSFGTYTCDDVPPPSLNDVLNRVVELNDGRGVHIFASAGNDETERPSWPAAFGVQPDLEQHVTSVGSVAPDTTTRSCFSNHGDPVEIWLIGEEVAANGNMWSGTSFAAPQALGLYAIGYRKLPEATGFGAPTVVPSPIPITWDDDGTVVDGETLCPAGEYEPTLPGLAYP